MGIRHIASGGWHNLTLQYSGRENLYSAEIVLQALESSSSTSKKYILYVQSIARDGGFVTGEVSLGFEVTSTNSTFIVAGSIGAVRSDATSGIRQCRCCDALQQRIARTWQKKGIALMGDEMALFLECLQLFRGNADF